MTGPPMLQGLDDTIGPALASLTDTVGTLLNPTAKFDQQLKAAFLEKPELMQKFVDVEKANPGTLKAFGFGEGATNFLSGMMESIDSLKDRMIQPAVAQALSGGIAKRTATAKAATGLTPGQLTADRLHEFLNQGGFELLKKDPEAFNRGITELLKLPSPLEKEVEATTLAALKKSTPLGDLTPPQIVTRLVSGNMTASELSTGLMNPQTKGGVEFALKMWQQEKNADLRKELQRIGHSQESSALIRAKLGAAIDQRKAAGYMGSIEAHYNSIWGEDYSTPPSAEEVKAVVAFQKDAEVGVRVKQQQNVLKAITPLIEQITPSIRKKGAKPINEERAKLLIGEMNKIFLDSGIPWEARYDVERHFFSANKPQIVYTNKAGMVTRDPSALFSTVLPIETEERKATPGNLSAQDRQAIVGLMSLTVEQRDSMIQRYYDAEKAAGGDGSRTDAIVDNLPAGEAEEGAE